LNPRADDREIPIHRVLGEFLPRGSLLVWIDEFLNQPYALSGRTLGHFENALLCSPMFPVKVQRQVHMISLSCGPDLKKETVQQHGSFGGYRFWEKGFYSEAGDKSRCHYVLREAVRKIPRNASGPPSIQKE
jgi:hypothetical protein